MTREIFADTAGWANYFLRKEEFHALARSLLLEASSGQLRVVTTNYVLAELVSLLLSPLRVPRSLQIKMLQTIRSAPWLEIVHIDRSLDEKAWTLLNERVDKMWSLVDCTSFVVMRARGISEVLSSDHHFEQAGFVRLLK